MKTFVSIGLFNGSQCDLSLFLSYVRFLLLFSLGEAMSYLDFPESRITLKKDRIP